MELTIICTERLTCGNSICHIIYMQRACSHADLLSIEASIYWRSKLGIYSIITSIFKYGCTRAGPHRFHVVCLCIHLIEINETTEKR